MNVIVGVMTVVEALLARSVGSVVIGSSLTESGSVDETGSAGVVSILKRGMLFKKILNRNKNT